MDQKAKKPSICFVALKAYGLLSGREDIQHIGGAEVQQTLIARELARRGYRVSFVVLDHGQPDGEDLDGIRVFKAFRRDAGVFGVRFLHPRMTRLWAAMRRADAEIYYQRNGGNETGAAAAWCRRHRRRFIFAVAHDAECDRRLPYIDTFRERALYRYGLWQADTVVTQTATQQRLMRNEFDRESTVIRSCALDPGGRTIERHERACQPRLVWLGRFAPVKGLEHLLDIAELCPEFQFDVVGDANADSAYVRAFRTRALRIPNVALCGRVPYTRVDNVYRGASALLNTSEAEGFPNTFLEAWSRGLPVLSRLDPDNLITEHGLGIVANEVGELARQIKEFFGLPALRERCSMGARRYFLRSHTVQVAVDAYERVLTR
ncbi:MAG: glycosyltransferase family 4 protein [Planctomycetes bacterium]|nr:glycosyltransferase family 4 protein [Planctomycetota bacterium]